MLPLFTLMWIKWLNTFKFKYLLFLLVVSTVFSSAFALPSSVLTVWIPALLYSCVVFIQFNNKIKIFTHSLLGLFLWLLASSWWIYPLWVFRNGSSLGEFNGQTNIEVLRDVSRYFPIDQIIFLKQKYLFGPANFWGFYYSQPKIYLITLAIFILVVLGILLSRKYKNWFFLLTLFFVSLFIVKGSNPPFGDSLYLFLFKYFSFTQVLRNPYEKFGAAFLIPYALFFGIGFDKLINFFKKISIPLAVIFFYAFFIFLVIPIWNGDMFPGYVHVAVPSYYLKANSYINENTKGRIFQLPFFNGSGIKYTWGYQGQEPSQYLFDRASLSVLYSVPKIDRFYQLLDKYLENPNFPKLLSIMSVESIVNHQDEVMTIVYHNDYFSSEKLINNWIGVSKGKNFGGLTVHILSSNYWLGEIYAVNNLKEVNSLNQLFDNVVSSEFNPHTEALIYQKDFNNDLKTKGFLSPQIIYKKISPNNFEIIVKNAKAPFVLVETSNYDPFWKASSEGKIFANHFMVNGFANGWLIDKKGDYQITVQYKVLPWD